MLWPPCCLQRVRDLDSEGTSGSKLLMKTQSKTKKNHNHCYSQLRKLQEYEKNVPSFCESRQFCIEFWGFKSMPWMELPITWPNENAFIQTSPEVISTFWVFFDKATSVYLNRKRCVREKKQKIYLKIIVFVKYIGDTCKFLFLHCDAFVVITLNYMEVVCFGRN